MGPDAFFLFGLGFYLFGMYMVVSFKRSADVREDNRADLAYRRDLQEKREFGYQTVQASKPLPKPSRFRRT